MDEQQRPTNPYRRTPLPQAGRPMRPAPPTHPVQPTPAPASFGQQFGAVAQDATRAVARATAARVEQKPQAVGTVLLWIGVVCGALGVLGGAVMIPDSVFSGIGMILMGVALVLPCAWPLRCRSLDRKALATWKEEQAMNRELVSFLTEEDADIARSLAPTDPPARSPRHWKPVWVTVAVLLVLSMVCIGLGDETLTEANERNSVGAGSGE